MNDISKEQSLLGIKVETTEGTFAEPTNSDYIETLEDGQSITKTRDLKERTLMSGSRLRKNDKLSTKNVEVELQVECKASPTEGEAPNYQSLFESFGFKNRGLTAAVVSTTGHTTSRININSGDASKFKKNDIVLIKEAGAFHMSPVSSVGADYIDLLIPLASAPADGVSIAKSQSLVLDKTQNKTLSVQRVFEGGQVLEKAMGCRTQSIQLQNFTGGEYPSWVFGLIGLTWEDELADPALSITPAYPANHPPLVVKACIYKNGVKITANEFAVEMNQTVAFKKSTCAANTKINSRGTGMFEVSGSFNPYKEQDNIEFTLDDSEFSIFVELHNPASNDGEFKECVGLFFPACKATAIELADVDGLHTDAVSWQLSPDGDEDSPVVAFI